MDATLTLKTIHVTSVIVSVSLFFIRGVWMMRGSPLLNRRWVRIVPHVNDTLLLASAIVLAMRIEQYPLVHPWLTAKVIGLLLYIGLGMAALRHAPTRRARVIAWFAALAVFGYIVCVALTHNPLPFIA
jgi:uncharacterized membrane protein SirB2